MADGFGGHEIVGRHTAEQVGLVMDPKFASLISTNNGVGGNQIRCYAINVRACGTHRTIMVAIECASQNQRKAPAQVNVAGPFVFGLILVYRVNQYRAGHTLFSQLYFEQSLELIFRISTERQTVVAALKLIKRNGHVMLTHSQETAGAHNQVCDIAVGANHDIIDVANFFIILVIDTFTHDAVLDAPSSDGFRGVTAHFRVHGAGRCGTHGSRVRGWRWRGARCGGSARCSSAAWGA